MTFSSKANTLVVRQRRLQPGGGIVLRYRSRPAPGPSHKGRRHQCPLTSRRVAGWGLLPLGQSRRGGGQGRG